MSAVDISDRTNPRYYTPAELPDGFGEYEESVDQLEVGSAGKVGLLELTFDRVAGETRLIEHFQQAPLQIFRPLSLDPNRPDIAFVHVIATGGGLLQGDRYRLDIDCRANTAVHLTTQAMTKIYRMEQNFATQSVNLKVGPNAFVEYLPDPIMPFRNSRFFNRTSLTIDESATFILGETLLPGRTAHGECHKYDCYVNKTEARSTDDRLLFADTVSLSPRTSRLDSPGFLATHDVYATLFIVSRAVGSRQLADSLWQVIEDQRSVLGGVSELPNSCGVSVRILGPTSADVQAAVRAIWNEARLRLIGVPAPDLRKN